MCCDFFLWCHPFVFPVQKLQSASFDRKCRWSLFCQRCSSAKYLSYLKLNAHGDNSLLLLRVNHLGFKQMLSVTAHSDLCFCIVGLCLLFFWFHLMRKEFLWVASDDLSADQEINPFREQLDVVVVFFLKNSLGVEPHPKLSLSVSLGKVFGTAVRCLKVQWTSLTAGQLQLRGQDGTPHTGDICWIPKTQVWLHQ